VLYWDHNVIQFVFPAMLLPEITENKPNGISRRLLLKDDLWSLTNHTAVWVASPTSWLLHHQATLHGRCDCMRITSPTARIPNIGLGLYSKISIVRSPSLNAARKSIAGYCCCTNTLCVCVPEKGDIFLLITLSNANRFPRFFYRQT